MDLTQAAWLISEGRSALEEQRGGLKSVGWQAELVREQAELRRRASSRFPDPERWLWTQRSLAQASDWWCASYKASRFPNGVKVVDGCCGAGVDLVALAGRGPAIGIDRDVVLVALAKANLATHGFENAVARAGDLPADLNAEKLRSVEGERLWLHMDPDRRVADSVERRLRKVEDYSPSLAESLEMARGCEAAMIKLAPASVLDPTVAAAFRSEVGLTRCWLGNMGECRQQLLLTGKLAESSERCEHIAVLCEPPANKPADQQVEPPAEPPVIAGSPMDTVTGREKPKRYIYDCHAVLHASQLQMTWAAAVDAEPLGTSQGYFTSDQLSRSPWSQAFEVVNVLPWDQRRVKRWLREHKIGEVEVKKRLLQLDANEYQRQLRGAGQDKITLMITRLGDRIRAVVARRVPS